jgi:hypothetical protein
MDAFDEVTSKIMFVDICFQIGQPLHSNGTLLWFVRYTAASPGINKVLQLSSTISLN